MITLKHLCNSSVLATQHMLQQHLRCSIHVCSSQLYPRQPRWRREVNDTEAARSVMTADGRDSLPVATQSTSLQGIERKAKKECNPVVLKCQEILASLVENRSSDEVEYTYKTNFGGIRFDKDNLPCLPPKVSASESHLEESELLGSRLDIPSDIDRQYFGAALDASYQLKSGSEAEITSNVDNGTNDGEEYIDRQFFGSALDRDIKKEQELSDRNAITDPSFVHSKQDINEDKDLNYIDEIYFKDVHMPEEKKSKPTEASYECKSDFERALLDIDDESCLYTPNSRRQLTPRVKRMEPFHVESHKKQASKPASKPDAPPQEASVSGGNIALQSDPSEYTNESSTINVSATKERLFNRKPKQSEEETGETAYDYVVELRRKKKKEEMQERGEDGVLLVPRYKTIISSVWNLSHRSRHDMKRLLKECVIYNDHDMVAIFKPYGMRVHGGGDGGRENTLTLMELLPELCEVTGANKLHHVHRLDVNTTGVMLLARTESTAIRLRKMFKEHELVKTYLTITKCVPNIWQGLIDIPLKESMVENKRRMGLRPVIEELNQRQQGGSKAVTKYKVLSSCNSAALLSVQPLTGVKHQIRAHLGLALACPILADHKYSCNTKMVPQKLPSDILHRLQIRQSRVRDLPLMLHASSIFLPQFVDGINVKISCPPPPHFTKMMKALKLNSKRNVTELKSLEYVDLGTDLV